MCQTLYGPRAVVVQSLSRVQLFATPWTAACQALAINKTGKHFPPSEAFEFEGFRWENRKAF